MGETGDRITGIRNHASLLADFIGAVGIDNADCPVCYLYKIITTIVRVNTKLVWFLFICQRYFADQFTILINPRKFSGFTPAMKKEESTDAEK